MDVTIRHAEPSDFEAVREVYAGSAALAGTLQLPHPSAELWRKRLAEADPELRALVAVVEGRLVGHLSLHRFSGPRRSHVATIGMAVHDEWQHRGIGSRLLEAALSLADNWLNVLRIELVVYEDNEPALRLYRRFGFVVEGTHRAFALRNGAYVDALAMARLHPRPPRLPPPEAT